MEVCQRLHSRCGAPLEQRNAAGCSGLLQARIAEQRTRWLDALCCSRCLVNPTMRELHSMRPVRVVAATFACGSCGICVRLMRHLRVVALQACAAGHEALAAWLLDEAPSLLEV